MKSEPLKDEEIEYINLLATSVPRGEDAAFVDQLISTVETLYDRLKESNRIGAEHRDRAARKADRMVAMCNEQREAKKRWASELHEIRTRLDEVTRERDAIGFANQTLLADRKRANKERDAALVRAEEAEGRAHHFEQCFSTSLETIESMREISERGAAAILSLASVREAAEGKTVPDTSAPWFDPETDDPTPYVCDCGSCDRCALHPTLDEVRAALNATEPPVHPDTAKLERAVRDAVRAGWQAGHAKATPEGFSKTDALWGPDVLRIADEVLAAINTTGLSEIDLKQIGDGT